MQTLRPRLASHAIFADIQPQEIRCISIFWFLVLLLLISVIYFKHFSTKEKNVFFPCEENNHIFNSMQSQENDGTTFAKLFLFI